MQPRSKNLRVVWLAGVVGVVLAVLFNLLAASCSRQPHSSGFAGPFAEIPIRVIDSSTAKPLVGAVVSPLCMGGTPYGTNEYLTDTRGIARAALYAGSQIFDVRVAMEGYQTGFAAFSPTNPVVALRRVE